MIYRCRVILDHQEDIFRDIEIDAAVLLEDFHNSIVQSFGFEGNEMASFYTTNEQWEQLEEIPLFDTQGFDLDSDVVSLEDTPSLEPFNMASVQLQEVLNTHTPKILYVYDFLNMWSFFVELMEVAEPVSGCDYPCLIYSHGAITDHTLNPSIGDSLQEELDLYGLEDEDELDDDIFSNSDFVDLDSIDM